MKFELRDYQDSACTQLLSKWGKGRRSLCLVAPPGAGKTEMAMACIRGDKTLWVVHQRELAHQAIDRLRRAFPDVRVGTIMGGHSDDPAAHIVVATVQAILSRSKSLQGFKFAYIDECHHYPNALEWNAVRASQPGGFQRELGGTATPQRYDGRGLSDVFEDLVVAAHYSELISRGYLLAPNIARPKRNLGSDWAKNPLDAWSFYGKLPGILWVPSIDWADHFAEQANERRTPAACISEVTTPARRARAIEMFEKGKVDLLTNVATLLEGIDLPMCQVAILGRPFKTIGAYLQATGRPLRKDVANPNKIALIIDLTGCVERHGLPHQDRTYSLSGEEPIGGTRPGVGGSTRVTDPTVLGVDLQDDFEAHERPTPVVLPDPDPKWWKAKKRAEDRYWKNVARFGKDIADQRM